MITVNSVFEVFKYIKTYGIFWTIKLILNKIGFEFFPEIIYPNTDIKVKVNFANYRSWKLISEGDWEPHCMKLLLDKIQKGQTILIIGAHYGPYTLLVSKLVGPEGEVYVFEPDPLTFDILLKNVSINQLKNVKCIKKGVGESEEVKKLYLYEGGGKGYSSLIQPKRNNIKFIETKMISINKYCSDTNIKPDGFIIDVEGFEKEVIKGGMRTITQNSSWVLLEFHAYFMDNVEKEKIWNLIRTVAKKVFLLNKNLKNLRTGKIIENLPKDSYFHLYFEC